MTHTAIICLGSNVADKEQRVRAAARHFGTLIHDISTSGLCVSDDYTGLGESYVNMVVSGSTALSLDELIGESRAYEAAHGRTAVSKPSGIMPIDVDIVVFDGRILKPEQYSRAYFQTAYEACRQAHNLGRKS